MSLWRKIQIQKERGLITLDNDTAERITLQCLIEHRDLIKDSLDHHMEGKWMHSDDVVYNKKLLKSLNRLIKYFGGDDEYKF